MSREYLPVPLPTELDALFGQYVAANQSPGLVYGLFGPDGLVHSAGFGTAGGSVGGAVDGSVDSEAAAPDADTVFPIASITKSFVAAGALLAADRGLVDLDAPISTVLPEVTPGADMSGDDAAPSIRQLLGMGGGLTEDNSWIDPFIGMPTDTLLAAVAGGLAYSNPPGVAFEYSNLGYALVGAALARATGAPLADWLTENLFTPLGLDSTRFDSTALPAGVRRATGFTLDADGAWTAFAPATSDAYAAAAGMRSTVRDLAAWATYLGSPFRQADPGGPLSPAARRAMQRVHYLYPPAETPPGSPTGPFHAAAGYGLGLVVRQDPTWGTIVAHSGGLPGFVLYLVWHPDSGHGLVVLTNSHRGNAALLAEDALTRALGSNHAAAHTIRLWPQTAHLLEAAETLIRTWDDDVAAEILAPNIAFDRLLDDRCADIERQTAVVGPLRPPRTSQERPDLVVAASPAHVTWAIAAERGELLCHIHVTPLREAQIQTLEVIARPYDIPRGARLAQLPAHGGIRAVPAPARHGRVIWPGEAAS